MASTSMRSINGHFLSPEHLTNDFFNEAHAAVMKDNTASVASRTMLEKLNNLTNQLEGLERDAFQTEMQNFYLLFTRYLAERVRGKPLDWNKIKSPNPEQIHSFSVLKSCPHDEQKFLLDKLAVLKLNGGLGTTMGCVGPKSAIEVREGLSFLDLTIQQIESRNSMYNTHIPLILMNSFNTDEETKSIIKKYESKEFHIRTFNQSRFPRITKDSLLPLAKNPVSQDSAWYPPGHGDVFLSLAGSGLLDELISEGKEYIFISNIDNLGATIDISILKHMKDTGAEFLMEVTDKTKADIKGGTIIDYDGNIRLLEIAQVPPNHVEDFKSIKKFKIFNTNNLWINLKTIKKVLENNELDLEIIVNVKSEEKTGEKVIQLETAVGAAIKHFKSVGLNVPRSRFLPVKSCSDLFIVQSDLYDLCHGELVINPARQFGTIPIVKLGDHFKKVQNFLSRFKKAPKILELDHLTVAGDVYFGGDVVLKGTVIIVANPPARIDIPSGSVLEDKVVTGDLRILEH